jgi:hypothetical protein
VTPFDADSAPSRWPRLLLFLASALAAAAILRFTYSKPAIAAGALGAIAALLVQRLLQRAKVRKLLRSGNVPAILARWSGTFERIPYRETMAPLMTATAFAAYGWTQEARAAMAACDRGPAWNAAIEHRLFLDALLLTFEGDRDGALEKASRLARIAGKDSDERGRLLRSSTAAFVRAFCHVSEPGDADLLEQASLTSPLIYWAMRYAAAVVAIDAGDKLRARTLVADAPHWPEQSTLRAFHLEILSQATA